MIVDNLAKTTRALSPHGPITLENGVWTAIEKKAAESGLSVEHLLSNWLANPQPGQENLESSIYLRLAKEMRPSALDHPSSNSKSTLEQALNAIYPL